MTSGDDGLRILGPLEARLGGEAIQLGGAKQRAALALLLLHAGEIVSVPRLIDEVWGDDPPPSAAHSLEAYISRLRRLLAGLGVRLLRRGAGYVLLLGDAALDARAFARLHDDAVAASAAGDDERTVEVAGAALALWRGAALADVPLGTWATVEVERLEERRLLVFEQRVDAELRLGRHEDLVGELQALVRHHPYRERLVALLLIALYRSGRPADALEAYEQTRRRLAEDLGLQPGTELRELSGRIVRHDPELRLAVPRWDETATASLRRRGRAWLALAGAVTASLVLVGGGSVRRVDAAPPPDGVRIALVLPRADASASRDTPENYAARILEYRQFEPSLGTPKILSGDVAHAATALARGDFDLVLWAGDGPETRAFAPRVRALPRTRFVFLDASLETLGLGGVDNASAVRFAREESSELVGYLSGLMHARGTTGRADVVSVVAHGSTRAALRVVEAFRRGARLARRDLRVLVDVVADDAARGVCERLANAQIDRGSDVVYAAAGRCGAGAAAVARIRGVWAAGGDDVDAGTHVLVQTYAERLSALDQALARFREGTLPAGGDLVLGLADDYAVGIDVNSAVPTWISSAVVRLCSSIRERTEHSS